MIFSVTHESKIVEGRVGDNKVFIGGDDDLLSERVVLVNIETDEELATSIFEYSHATKRDKARCWLGASPFSSVFRCFRSHDFWCLTISKCIN